MRLAIVILNYRTPDLTIACLASLEGQAEVGRDQVIVVDNHSEDGSADQIEQTIQTRNWTEWAAVRRSPVNGGFAAGNNLALRETDAEYYLLLNSDTVVPRGAIDRLLQAGQEHPEAGIIGPSFEEEDGQWSGSCFRDHHPVSELLNSAATGPITRLLAPFNVPRGPFEHPVCADWIGFACVLIRRAVIQQIGLLDEGFFMYYEDADYCRRARAAGWQILYWPEVRVLHYLGASSQISNRVATLRRRPQYYYAARSRYFRKHYGWFGLVSANLLWTLGRFVSWTREHIGRKQPHTRPYEWYDIWTDVCRRLPTTDQSNRATFTP